MASGTLNIKLALENKDQFIKDIEARVSKSVSNGLVDGLKEGWKKSAEAMQDALSKQKLAIHFDEKKIRRDAIKIADQIREAAKFSVRTDFKDATAKFGLFNEELKRYRKYNWRMNEREKKASLTKLEILRKENKKYFEQVKDEAADLLTSTDADERKQGREIMERMHKAEKQSVKAVHGLSRGFKDLGSEFGELGNDLDETRGKAGKLFESVKEKGKGLWEAMHSSTMHWIEGLAAAYLSYSAVKTAIFDLIDLQDKLADATKGSGVAAAESWEFMVQASEVLLDFDQAGELAGEVAQYGRDAFAALSPLSDTFAKMKLLGTDVNALTEDFAALSQRYSRDVVPAIKDFSETMYNIENKTLRDKAMQTLVRQAQIMGTQGPKWLATASRGMVAVTKALEGMGVRTSTISDFMESIAKFNPFSDQQDAFGETFQNYLDVNEQTEMIAARERGDMEKVGKLSMEGLIRERRNLNHFFEGDETQRALGKARMMNMEGMTEQKLELLTMAGQDRAKFEDQYKKIMDTKVDPRAMEKEYEKRQGTFKREMQELKHTWEKILMDLGKEFLPVIKEFSEHLLTFLQSKDFKNFAKDMGKMTKIFIEDVKPALSAIYDLIKFLLRLAGDAAGIKMATAAKETTEHERKLAVSAQKNVERYTTTGTNGKRLSGDEKLRREKKIAEIYAERAKREKETQPQFSLFGKDYWRGFAKLSREPVGDSLRSQAISRDKNIELLKAGGGADKAARLEEIKKKMGGELEKTQSWSVGGYLKGFYDMQVEPYKWIYKKLSGSGDEAKAKDETKKSSSGLWDVFGDAVKSLFSGVGKSIGISTDEALPKLQSDVTKRAGETLKVVDKKVGHSEVWEAVEEGIKVGITNKLPEFQRSVTASTSSLYLLISETFDQIFKTGHEELERLKNATATYTSSQQPQLTGGGGGGGGAPPAATSGSTSGGGSVGDDSARLRNFLGWLKQKNLGETIITGINSAGGDPLKAFQRLSTTPSLATEISALGQQYQQSVPGAVMPSIAPQTITPISQLAPGPQSMPIGSAQGDLTVAQGLQGPSQEERLLARAVTYLGGIFVNTNKQNGFMGQSNTNAAYKRLMDSVNADLSLLTQNVQQ